MLGEFIKDHYRPLRWWEAWTPNYTDMPEISQYWYFAAAKKRAYELQTKYNLNAQVSYPQYKHWKIFIDFDNEADEAEFILKVSSEG